MTVTTIHAATTIAIVILVTAMIAIAGGHGKTGITTTINSGK